MGRSKSTSTAATNGDTPEVAEVDPAISAYVAAKFDQGWTLREEYTDLIARRKANRTALRNAADAGDLTAEQLDELAELYPKHHGKSDDADAAEVEAAPAPTPEPAAAA